MISRLQASKLANSKTWERLQEESNRLVDQSRKRGLLDLGLALLVGLMAGVMLVYSWGLSSSWQGLIFVIPMVVTFVLLTNNLERVVLAAIAVSVPLNLDVSLVISPYARNLENLAHGNRTLATLTELRFSLVTILLLIGYGLWLISDRKSMRFFGKTTGPILGLLFMSLLSLMQAQDLQLSSFRIALLLEVFLMYFYLVNHIKTIDDLKFFLIVSLAAMLAENILMLVQWNTGLEFIIAGIKADASPYRVSGTLGSEGPAGGYLSALTIIAVAAIWAFREPRHRWLAIACAATGFPALISTGSRAGWTGFTVSLLIFIGVTFWRRWAPRNTLAVLFLAVLVFGAIFFQPIYTRLTEDDGGSAESRPMMYRLAWNVIQAHMWVGVGANNYALMAKDYYTPDVGNLGYVVNSVVHNLYLATWAETGLFGFLFFVAMLVAPLLQALGYIARPSRHRFVNLVALGFGCALISLSIQMFTGAFFQRSITYFIWVLLALLTTLRDLKRIPAVEPLAVPDPTHFSHYPNIRPRITSPTVE